MARTIETQRQAKTPLQLLCLPNAPFVETIVFGQLRDYGLLPASGGWKTLSIERDDRLTMQGA